MAVQKTLLFCVLAAVVALSCQSGPTDGVAAVVDGHNITYDELEKYYQSQIQEVSEPPTNDQAQMLRLNLLREVIDRHIILHRAEKLGLMAVDSEVDARFEEYRSPYATEEDFKRSLEERGVTSEDLKTELRRTITIQKLFNKEVTSRITVSESELRASYEQNRASFNLPEQQVHLAQIVVTATPDVPVPNLRNDDAKDLETAQAKIEMIAQQLANGEDFAVLAQNFSEDLSTSSGGDLGFIPQSQLENADITLRRVVASLSPGEVSPVIKTDEGFRIIKLISIEPAGQRDFSDPRVQQTIRETLLNRKDQLLKAAYLEVARNEAKVENYFARRVISSFGSTD